jgi:hypothetical protein
VGRPRKYDDKFIEALADKLDVYFVDKSHYYLGQFCAEHGLYPELISDFAKKSIAFAQALKRAKQMQEARLVERSMSKEFNPAGAIFALKNVAGWRDKQDITTNDESISEVKVTIVKRAK